MTFTWSGSNPPERVDESPAGFLVWNRRRHDGRQASGHVDPHNGQSYEVVSWWGGRSASRTAANRRAREGVTLLPRRVEQDEDGLYVRPRRGAGYIRWGGTEVANAAVDTAAAVGFLGRLFGGAVRNGHWF